MSKQRKQRPIRLKSLNNMTHKDRRALWQSLLMEYRVKLMHRKTNAFNVMHYLKDNGVNPYNEKQVIDFAKKRGILL